MSPRDTICLSLPPSTGILSVHTISPGLYYFSNNCNIERHIITQVSLSGILGPDAKWPLVCLSWGFSLPTGHFQKQQRAPYSDSHAVTSLFVLGVSLCKPGCLTTNRLFYLNHQMLGLWVCTTTVRHTTLLLLSSVLLAPSNYLGILHHKVPSPSNIRGKYPV